MTYLFFQNKHLKKYYRIRKINRKESFCYAPFVSLYFSFNGNIFPCHNNNTWPLGNISKQSILEIWNSQNIKTYRKHLKKNQLNEIGCLQCSKDLNLGNYHAINALRYDYWSIFKDQPMPTVMGFRFSDVCNLKCVMCLSNSFTRGCNVNDPAMVYDDSFFKQMELFIPHLKYTFFLGGDPFIEPLNYTLWEMITKTNPECKISVQTNGTILNDRIKNILQKGNFDINVSIDSVNKSLFESIRVNSDFDKVLENIEFFRNYCSIKKTLFSSCFTPMRMNWQEIPDFIRIYNKTNNAVWFNKYYFPARYGLWTLSSKSLSEIISILSAEHFDDISESTSGNLEHFNGLMTVLNSNLRSAIIRETLSLNFKHEAEKLKNKLWIEIQNFISLFDPESEVKNNAINEKLNLMLNYHHQKAYYYFKLLIQTFAGEKLLEVLNNADEESLLAEIESVFVN